MPRLYTRAELIEHLQGLAREHGRTPTTQIIDSAAGPCPNTYARVFGSLRAAQEEAGLDPTYAGAVAETPGVDRDLDRPVSERLREGYALLDEESER